MDGWHLATGYWTELSWVPIWTLHSVSFRFIFFASPYCPSALLSFRPSSRAVAAAAHSFIRCDRGFVSVGRTPTCKRESPSEIVRLLWRAAQLCIVDWTSGMRQRLTEKPTYEISAASASVIGSCFVFIGCQSMIDKGRRRAAIVFRYTRFSLSLSLSLSPRRRDAVSCLCDATRSIHRSRLWQGGGMNGMNEWTAIRYVLAPTAACY